MTLYHMELVTTEKRGPKAREVVAGGDIIIARGHQAYLIKQSVAVPVVEIVMTAQEIGALVLQAKRSFAAAPPSDRINGYANMFCDYEPLRADVRHPAQLLFRTGTAPSAEANRGAVQAAVPIMLDIIIGGDI